MKFVPRDLGEAADVSRGRLAPRAAIKLVVAAVLAMVVGYFGLGLLGELLASRLSPAREAKLFAELDLPEARAPDAAVPAEAAAVKAFIRLRETSDPVPLSYRLVILPHEIPNALALPGGLVAVTSGLLEVVNDEIGLSMVLAHELGHHQHRHAVRRLGRGLAIQVAFALLFGGEMHGALASAERLASSAHSREQERQADAFGLRAVHRAYGTLEGALTFFEAMAERGDEGGVANRIGGFWATHPMTGDRLGELRRLAAELAAGGIRR